MTLDWAIVGGFVAGSIAGAGAQFGRLCTMGAIERALIGRDFRSAKAWGLAALVAVVATQAGLHFGAIDLTGSLYTKRDPHVLGTVLGGLLFGLGMSLAGTCSFGLIVKSGTGDMRAALTAIVVGISAFAVTSGLAAPAREWLLGYGNARTANALPDMFLSWFGPWGHAIVPALGVLLMLAIAIDRRLRRRPRLLIGSSAVGLAVAVGWICTTRAVEALTLDRAETLSFVAPVGRLLLQIMVEPFRNVGFGVATLFGVALASFAVAFVRGDFRWEAFDDAIEMRRHLFGAVLMGVGGVLGQGCTIGQGLSAASTLALTAPIFIGSVVAGARIGLWHLMEGRDLRVRYWRE